MAVRRGGGSGVCGSADERAKSKRSSCNPSPTWRTRAKLSWSPPQTKLGVACFRQMSAQSVFGSAAIAAWKDALRIVYGGQSKDSPLTSGRSLIANKSCNSDLRRALVSTYPNFFEGACTGVGCTRLEHAWRRADLSGTTDTFLELLNLPAITAAPFCNGNESEDLDPVRRACGPNDDVCGGKGDLVPNVPALYSVGSLASCASFAACPADEVCVVVRPSRPEPAVRRSAARRVWCSRSSSPSRTSTRRSPTP
ncbi:MAG: hypothetical protein HC923_08450 [Myxococcales bacterium]|nr:hypothetical protein [Myxococcales bacterium]